MMSAWWLIIIVPVCVSAGISIAALCKAAGDADRPNPDYEEDTKGPSGLLEEDT